MSRAVYDIGLTTNSKSFERYAEAIRIIVLYLDYRLPDEGSKYHQATSSNRDPYPASSALTMIGKPAVPELLEAIGRKGTSDTARLNAISTLFKIFSKDDLTTPVRLLKSASEAADDGEISVRFRQAAQRAADECRGVVASRCREVLHGADGTNVKR